MSVMAAQPKVPRKLWMIVLGIAIITVWYVIANRAMRGDLDTAIIGDLKAAALPSSVMNLGRFGLLLTLAAGVACALERIGKQDQSYLTLVGLSLIYSFIMAARTLQPHDLVTYTIYSSLAPLCVLASCLIFASADRGSWRFLSSAIAWGSLLVALLAFAEIAQLRSATREEAYWRLYTYSSILEVGAVVSYAWFAGRGRPLLGAIPVLALAAASIVMQTRLMLIELVCLAGFLMLFSRWKVSLTAVASFFLVVLMLAWTVWLVRYSSLVESWIPSSVHAFYERSDEDTRSGQFVNFFSKVPAETFFLGVGIPREGEFNGLGSKGIDLGYVNILFLGGIPALLLYFSIHIAPSLRCLGSRFDLVDAACLSSVLTYGVRLFSSTIPSIEPQCLILMLLVGHTIELSRRQTAPAGGFSRAAPASLWERQTI